ncbi:MAG: glutaredoxin domain-containing protein [Thermoanaerobaculia bacterium]|nr:glutaredoxin domain-containing protein [Thermoanaerobaculia bacterium]
MTRYRWKLLAVVLIGAMVAVSAPGDWLVTLDGARLETQGPWEIRGSRVVFTDVRGTLCSLSFETIDLTASREATEEVFGRTQTEVREEETRSLARVARRSRLDREQRDNPVLVLTDADVARVDPEVLAALEAREAELPRVVLYATSWCPWCEKSRRLLAALGVSYTEKDIEKQPGAAAEMRRKVGGETGVPVLDIGGTLVRGYDRETIIRVLKSSR